MTDRHSGDIRGQIAQLPDDSAVRALRLFVEARASSLDAAQLMVQLDEIDRSNFEMKAEHLSDGDLARATLAYLAEIPDCTELLWSSVETARSNERIDSYTVEIGVVALLALQTEIRVKRLPDGRWTFDLHKHRLSDSAIAQIVTGIINKFKT